MYGQILGLAILAVLGLAMVGEEEPDYVALGDSLAAGIAAFGTGGYVSRYRYWLAMNRFGNDIKLYNAGIPGLTSQGMLNNIRKNPQLQARIQCAKIITLDIGANDISKTIGSDISMQESISYFETTLNETMILIRSLNPNAYLYVMDIYNPYPVNHGLYQIAEQWISTYNQVIWKVCGSSRYAVSGIASVYDAFRGNEKAYTWISLGSRHPNDRGHEAIASCFINITK